MDSTTQHQAKQAVIKVGEGRGFVLEIHDCSVEKLVVATAAHCLPVLPPADPWCDNREKTYMNFLGPLGVASPSITAACLFADPIADIAFLGEVDEPTLSEAFRSFLAEVDPLQIRNLLTTQGTAWLLSLEGDWMSCQFDVIDQGLWLRDGNECIKGGMSGSPIVVDDGRVIGLISNSREGEGRGTDGPQPRLPHCLPIWAWNPSDDT